MEEEKKITLPLGSMHKMKRLRHMGNAMVHTLLAAVVSGTLLVVGVQQYVEITAHNKVEKTINEILVALAEYQIFGKLIAQGMNSPRAMEILKLPIRNQFGGGIHLPAISSGAMVIGPDGVARFEKTGFGIEMVYEGVPATHCFKIVSVVPQQNRVRVSAQQPESHPNLAQAAPPAYQCHGKQGLVDIFIALSP
jgi:hypothetical protein